MSSQKISFAKPFSEGACISLGAQLFALLWANYKEGVPNAISIEDELKNQGEVWSEDHVAFRSFEGSGLGADILQCLFEKLGYTREDSFVFKEKKLSAFWMAPPGSKKQACVKLLPKVFISQLDITTFSEGFKGILASLTAQGSSELLSNLRNASESSFLDLALMYLTSTPPWGRMKKSAYDLLLKESEYAAWTSIFGSQANHFTVSVHLMAHFTTLRQLNTFIEEKMGIPMNRSGGSLIKGTPELLLEQSSTLAAKRNVLFQEGVHAIPFAFIEFAYRYPLTKVQSAELWQDYYQGFQESNADKIFESTNVTQV